ncbi:hypothetical protein Tco_0726110 [Tanacetum coccineum]|uniref:Uncharacterized protein n=1 Tax=Tanacetum coccineum TaxID=301880 RepID=A0ABQ4YEQ0_9ASTR
MGGSSSQRRTYPHMSLIHAFSIEDMYTPQFLDAFQENTSYSQEPNREESLVDAVATSLSKMKKLTKARQKRMIQSDDAPRPKWKESELSKFAAHSGGGSKRYKSFGSSSFNTEFREASINLNTNVGDSDEDERASGLSSMNDEELARLMVTKMTTQEKEQRDAFIEIKMREVECRERELAA